MAEFPVRIVPYEEMREHRRERFLAGIDDPWFSWIPGTHGFPDGFMWECPGGCNNAWHGSLGDEPVSGWEAPRWLNTGTLEQPTMAPSFGCPSWRRGQCSGHYWMRNGVLVQA
jgi:hypothetical protein